MRHTRTGLIATLALVLALGAGVACGDDDGDDDGLDVGGIATEVVDEGQDAATSIADDDEDGDGADTPAAGGDEGGDAETLEIAAENANEFTKDELSASPGDVTVIFENNDEGVIHNIAFFAGDSASAERVAETDLEAGPVTQEVTFTVEEGEYFYHCDVHPGAMEGTLTVE